MFELNDRSQAFLRLLSGRADLYINGQLDIQTLLHRKQHQHTQIYEVGVVARLPVYGFLNRKHKDLAPQVADIFRETKKAGLIEKYERQVTGN